MTFLLVRLEINPGKSDLLSVPPSHVFKLMFLHEQTSDLNVTENGKPIGNLVLRPKIDPASGNRTMLFSGGLSIPLPGTAKRQRISWDGVLSLDPELNTRDLVLTFGLQEPPYRIHLDLVPQKKLAYYEIRQGNQLLRKSAVETTESGLSSFLKDELGVDSGMISQAPVSVGTPLLTAKQTELKIRNERIVAYLLTLKQGETTVADIYVSQLGQVLAAKTLLGYNLSTEDMTPP